MYYYQIFIEIFFKICYVNGSKVDTVDITLKGPARQEVPKEMKTNSSRYLEFTRNKIWITFSADWSTFSFYFENSPSLYFAFINITDFPKDLDEDLIIIQLKSLREVSSNLFYKIYLYLQDKRYLQSTFNTTNIKLRILYQIWIPEIM